MMPDILHIDIEGYPMRLSHNVGRAGNKSVSLHLPSATIRNMAWYRVGIYKKDSNAIPAEA